MYVPEDYVITEDAVTLRGTPLKGADPATFEHLYGYWARDRRSVFWAMYRRSKIDGATFEPLNAVWGRDAKTVFAASGTPLTGVKPREFRVYDAGIRASYPLRVSHPSNEGYGGDSKRVFFHQETYASAGEVKGADPATFVSMGAGYGRDADHVFYERRRVQGARPRSFYLIRGVYAADEGGVYRAGRKIEGADPRSFVVLGPGSISQMARDKHRYYNGPQPSTREKYVELLKEQEKSLREHRAKVESGQFDETYRLAMVDFR